jgi:2-C-methyl-D-erythritol 4-phosphate cytidylyltransferase
MPGMEPRRRVAVLLAGGTGTRIGPAASGGTPKQLLEVGGRTLLEHALHTFHLTQTRGKKAEVLILPIGLSDEEKESIEEIKTEIAAVDTLEKLKAVAFVVKNSSKAIQDAVRDCYAKRQAELKDLSKPNTGETK